VAHALTSIGMENCRVRGPHPPPAQRAVGDGTHMRRGGRRVGRPGAAVCMQQSKQEEKKRAYPAAQWPQVLLVPGRGGRAA
jgi:hypothetical protein